MGPRTEGGHGACPFCGSESRRVVRLRHGFRRVRCDGCGALGPKSRDRRRAVTFWERGCLR